MVAGEVPSSLGTRVEQYQNNRGGGGEHPYSGVGEGDDRNYAALRYVVGVGPNSDAGEAVDGVSVYPAVSWYQAGSLVQGQLVVGVVRDPAMSLKKSEASPLAVDPADLVSP